MSRDNKTDSRRYFDWLSYAAYDVIAAKKLRLDERTFLCSAFHAHQAVEKSLKAFYLFDGGYAPDGHNVIYLCRRLMRDYPEFGQWLDECVDVNPYYISTRYPPDIPISLSDGKLLDIINSAERLYKFVNKRINTELEKEKNK